MLFRSNFELFSFLDSWFFHDFVISVLSKRTLNIIETIKIVIVAKKNFSSTCFDRNRVSWALSSCVAIIYVDIHIDKHQIAHDLENVLQFDTFNVTFNNLYKIRTKFDTYLLLLEFRTLFSDLKFIRVEEWNIRRTFGKIRKRVYPLPSIWQKRHKEKLNVVNFSHHVWLV